MATTTALIGTGLVVTAGKDILLSGITESAKGVISGVSYLLSTSSRRKGLVDLRNLLEEHDTEAQIKVVEAFVNQLSADTLDEASSIALHNLKECLEKMEKELANVKHKEEQYQTYGYLWKWVYGSPDFSGNYETLVKCHNAFQRRFDILLKILSKRLIYGLSNLERVIFFK